MPKVPSGARNKKLCGGEKVNVKKHTSVIISPAREMSVKSGKRSAVSRKYAVTYPKATEAIKTAISITSTECPITDVYR